MFEIKKTLIVVYKDELLVNQLKKMVETHSSSEQSGIENGRLSINLVSWTEKVWLENKKAGNIQEKILFLDEIKGTDKLIPVIDVKFDEYGIKFGWAGNQAIVYADPKALNACEDYNAFLEKLSTLSVPNILMTAPHSQTSISTNHETNSETPTKNEIPENVESNKNKKFNVFQAAHQAVLSGTDTISRVRTQVASKFEEIFRSKRLMKRQMLFFGVINLYNDGLEKFMNI